MEKIGIELGVVGVPVELSEFFEWLMSCSSDLMFQAVACFKLLSEVTSGERKAPGTLGSMGLLDLWAARMALLHLSGMAGACGFRDAEAFCDQECEKIDAALAGLYDMLRTAVP